MDASQDPDDSTKRVSRALLGWYDANARALPWRAPPGAAPMNAYRVWLSEVMLQQTTVAAVIPYFERFTREWPDVHALAAAPTEAVMAAWAGLGYYARARSLIACARAVAAAGGRFPDTEAGLRALPGLGPYTAAAVAAIAFGRRAVVVDANVERVVARLLAIDTPLPEGKAAIRAGADAITPAARAGDFAQAMMDLGSGICTNKRPRCLLCPLSEVCAARRTATPEAFPVKRPKVPRPERCGRAFWIMRDGVGGAEGAEVWLVRRVGKGLLGGMRALPDDGWTARKDGADAPPLPGPWESAGVVRHIFTHFALTLELSRYRGNGAVNVAGEGEWWPIARLDEAGLPTAFARAAGLALAQMHNPTEMS